MRAFRFRLEKVLRWRRAQMELEELRVKQLTAALRDLDRAMEQLDSSRVQAERAVRSRGSIQGSDLAALAAYRQYLDGRKRALRKRRLEQENCLAEQHRILCEARRRVRLLEKLRDQRLAEWSLEQDREMEALASELHLARRSLQPPA